MTASLEASASLESIVTERLRSDEEYMRLDSAIFEGVKDGLIQLIRTTMRKEKIEQWSLTTMLMIDSSVTQSMWLLRPFVIAELQSRIDREMLSSDAASSGAVSAMSILEKKVKKKKIDSLIRQSEKDARDEIRRNFTEDDDAMPNWNDPCPKCGLYRVYTYSKQIRSADEAATLFFVCLSCGARWTC